MYQGNEGLPSLTCEQLVDLMWRNMKRNVCVIIGSGEGMGQALSARFARGGFDIALVSRSKDNSRKAIETAKAADDAAQIRFYPSDVTNPETLQSTISLIADEMGSIEVLIYNVRGSFTACDPLDMSVELLENNYRIEVVGAFAAAKAVLPKMIEQSHGTIFFSSATAAFRGSASYPLYSIGKFGLRALSQSLAKAYSKHRIHIVHMRLDCDLDVPIMRSLYGDSYNPDTLANPNDVAENYWLTFQQPSGAWSNEVEIRPNHETWTY